MRLSDLRRLKNEELSELTSERESFVLYVRSEKDSEVIREMFDVDVVFPELARSFPQVPFYVVELSEAREPLRKLGVLFAPSVLTFREGKLIRRMDGIKSWSEYTEAVGELLC